MYWRLTNAEFERRKGAGNKRALKALVSKNRVPGVIAYAGRTPIGWCSFGPRPEFVRFERSRILKPVDDEPVWSIVCLFVVKDYRKQGVSRELIEAAAENARRRGASCIEAYPVEPRKDPMPPVFAFTGIASAYRKAGFSEVARRSPTRPIMRLAL